MNKSVKLISLALIAMLSVIALGLVGCSEEETPKKVDETVKLTMATGISSGNYYNIGESLAVILKKPAIELTVNETNGSSENVDLLLQNRTDLGIVMLDVAKEAYERPKTSDAAIGTDLRVMMALYPSVVQIITTEDTGIKTFKDIKYKKIGVCSDDSADPWKTDALFEAHGMSVNDCEVKATATKDVATMLKEREIDVAFIMGTVPNAMIAEIEKDKKQKLQIIPIAGAERQALVKKYPFFQNSVIPENSYGKNKEIDTVSMMNILLVNKKVSDAAVEKILNTMESKLVELEAALGNNELISLESPVSITNIPLHPGAKKYFDTKK